MTGLAGDSITTGWGNVGGSYCGQLHLNGVRMHFQATLNVHWPDSSCCIVPPAVFLNQLLHQLPVARLSCNCLPTSSWWTRCLGIRCQDLAISEPRSEVPRLADT